MPSHVKLGAVIAANGGPTFLFMPMVLTLNIQQPWVWFSGVHILLAINCNILQFPAQPRVINSRECLYNVININNTNGNNDPLFCLLTEV